MKIGVIGSGDVGRSLAAGFLRHGHEVTVGTRSPDSLAAWRRDHGAARVGAFAEAAKFGQLVVLAIKGSAALSALQAAGAANLQGKVVIDATNPIADLPPQNNVLRYFTTHDESLMERLQAACPEARFVKAFNQVNHAHMVDPEFDGIRPTMFICGNDAAAKADVARILDEFGWETEDVGRVEAARAIEPLCMLWVARFLARNESSHAFKLLK